VTVADRVARRPGGILLAALALFCLTPLAVLAQPSLRIVPDVERAPGSGGWHWPAPWPASVEVDVEFGDDPAGSELLIGNADAPYRVQVQFETSLAIGDEGPHLDLTGWKHCRSDWHLAAVLAPRRFRLPVPTDAEAACFPPVSTDELVQAIRTAARQDGFDAARWTSLVPPRARPGDAPTYVAISTMRVRVERRVGGRWQPATMLVFRLPMGC
jgi:hypothetical protein